MKTAIRLVNIIVLLALAALIIATIPSEGLWWSAIITNMIAALMAPINVAIIDWNEEKQCLN